jgi:hypothetical protein
MGFFNALGKLGKATVSVVMLPVDVVKDTVTMGGATIDEESAVVKRVKKIARNTSEAIEEIDE